MIWTDALTEEAKRLRSEGESASIIAALLGHGLTRNAVIGRFHRLGLTGGSATLKPVHPTRKHQRTSKRVLHDTKPKLNSRATAAPAVRKAIPLAAPVSKRLTLAELHAGMCKYTEDDGPIWTFCANLSVKGGSYCEFHDRLCRPGAYA